MNAHFPDGGFPDDDTVRTVLTLATRAPSLHNSQPWHWRIGRNSMHLYSDPSRHQPHADPDRRDLLLSCGASLHHCATALGAQGWHARIRRMPDPAHPEHLAQIDVVRQPASDLEVMLAAAIPDRRTDRRAYSPWPVPWGDIALMGARSARAGVMLRQIDPLPRFSSTGANGAVIALGTETDDDLSRLRAGEATSLVLLSATAMGLASCPVSEPLEIAETREMVREDAFGDSGYPQMIVRVGWAVPGTEPLPPSPRRPLQEVADWRRDTVGSGSPHR